MPFVSGRDKREMAQSLVPFEYAPEVSFGEVYAASVGMVIDEELSISSSLNREGWSERKSVTDELIASGQIDRDTYTVRGDRRGQRSGRHGTSTYFDYNRLAMERPELGIKSDEVLSEERNKLLAQRRNYAQDVIERGSGMAQFLGMASGYMLDPVNIATIGVATAPTALKSLSVMGRALMVARNEAALNVAAELAIQPLVYGHKTEIGSPYSAQDAINNIGFAALGGAALGGAVGGIGGYISKVRKAAETLEEVTPEVEQALEYLARMEDSLASGRATRNTPDAALADYDAMMQGEYGSFLDASKNTIKESQKIIDETLKQEDTLSKFFAKAGGIDRALIEAEGIDPASFSNRGKVFGKPLFKKAGKSADELAERLNEIGYRGGRNTANDVVDMIDDITRGNDPFVNAESSGVVEYHQKIIDDLSASQDEDYLKGIYGDIRGADIEEDIRWLKELDEKKLASAAPTKVPDDYVEPPQPKPPTAKSTAREREILELTGMKSDFDADMDAYSRIDNPLIIDGDDVMDGKAVMKELDDEIEGIESVLVCAYG